MAHSFHEFPEVGTCLGGECVACVPQIVKVDGREPGSFDGLRPGTTTEVAGPQRGAGRACENERVSFGSGELGQVAGQVAVRSGEVNPASTAPNTLGTCRSPHSRRRRRHDTARCGAPILPRIYVRRDSTRSVPHTPYRALVTVLPTRMNAPGHPLSTGCLNQPDNWATLADSNSSSRRLSSASGSIAPRLRTICELGLRQALKQKVNDAHARKELFGRARHVPDRAVNHGHPRPLTDKSQCWPPGTQRS